MKPYQQRVIEEKKQLDEKLDKLTEFLKSPATDDLAELERLGRQREIMNRYSGVLAERIAHFNG